MPTDLNADFGWIRRSLLAWFDEERRDLPWRALRHPYTTWVSEVMLQQTRVDQVVPYYARFISAFPSVDALATADPDDVMRCWEGLGYYARARNLHRAAGIVAEGGFPASRDGWLKLPGVGPYTAAAIASIVHDEPVAAVDGNVARVVSRLFVITDEKGTAAFDARVAEHVSALLSTDRPGDFNEAMMDLGATVCAPRKPACPKCPLLHACRAAADGVQESLPKRAARAPIPTYAEAAAILTDMSGRLLLFKRPTDGLLGGLWEFPVCRVDGGSPESTLKAWLTERTGLRIEVARKAVTVRHAYSHFRIEVDAFECALVRDADRLRDQPQGRHADNTGFTWTSQEELGRLPMHRAHRRIADALPGITPRRQPPPTLS